MDCAAGQKASRHQGIQASRGGTASSLCGVPCFGRSDSRYPSQTARSLRREGWIDTGLFCCACIVAAAAVVTFMPPLAKRVMEPAKQQSGKSDPTKGPRTEGVSDRTPSVNQTPHEPSGERFGFMPALPEGLSFSKPNANNPFSQCAVAHGGADKVVHDSRPAVACPPECPQAPGGGRNRPAPQAAPWLAGSKVATPTRTSLLFARVFRPGRIA